MRRTNHFEGECPHHLFEQVGAFDRELQPLLDECFLARVPVDLDWQAARRLTSPRNIASHGKPERQQTRPADVELRMLSSS
jgi:hypothetical protein